MVFTESSITTDGVGEARREYEDGLLQIPIDLTTRLYSEIADLEVPDHVKKIFVVSYPHPSIPKVLLRFKTKGWTLIYDVRDEWEEFSKVGAASCTGNPLNDTSPPQWMLSRPFHGPLLRR